MYNRRYELVGWTWVYLDCLGFGDGSVGVGRQLGGDSVGWEWWVLDGSVWVAVGGGQCWTAVVGWQWEEDSVGRQWGWAVLDGSVGRQWVGGEPV